jgi:hypothetical protein
MPFGASACTTNGQSRDSLIRKLRYGMEDRKVEFRLPAGDIFFCVDNVRTGCGASPSLLSSVYRGLFCGSETTTYLRIVLRLIPQFLHSCSWHGAWSSTWTTPPVVRMDKNKLVVYEEEGTTLCRWWFRGQGVTGGDNWSGWLKNVSRDPVCSWAWYNSASCSVLL